MGVQFRIGRSGTGKTTQCLEEIRDDVQRYPMGKSIIYLCPEQMTFQIEQTLAKDSGSIRAGVYSFTRLAWKILQEVGGSTRIHINQQGIEMLLRKIVEGKKDELHMYQRAAEQPGFYSQVAEQLSELKRYNHAPEQVQELFHHVSNPMLQMKMKDIGFIYEQYEQQMGNKYVDSEDYLRLLIDKIPQSSFLQDCTIYIDGFYSFSVQELAVISSLQQVCAEMKIVLTVEEVENELFKLTQKTYHQLRELTKENGVSIHLDEINRRTRRYENNALRHLESTFEQRPIQVDEGCEGIVFAQCANLRSEVEKIAREICRLVKEKDVRYKEIVVIGRNIQTYMDLIRTVFQDYHIPFHTDEKKAMTQHPYVEMLLAIFEIIEQNWRLDAVFRGLKTGLLLDCPMEKIDLLENYCLAYGMKGSNWTSEKKWEYSRFKQVKTDEELEKERELNQLRQQITEPIVVFHKQLKKARNVKEMCELFYEFLEKLHIREKLEQLSLEAEEQKALLEAKEHGQAWEATMSLLDQLVELVGEEPLSIKIFLSMMKTGLEGLEFANVPSSLDQVIIASLDHSRVEEMNYLFLLGLNEGVLPAVGSEQGVLSDEDREQLAKQGINLNPTTKQRLMDEEFAFYMGVVKPKKGLHLSCSLADMEGKSLFPSVYYKRLKDMFPHMEERYISNDLMTTGEREEALYCAPIPAFTYLMEKFQLFKDKNIPLGRWVDVYHAFIQQDNTQPYKKCFKSLTYRNEAEKLKDDVSSGLYGDEIVGSVSRIETFNSCPYKHFANYGLRLKEREIYNFEAPDIGQLFHDALKTVTDTMLAHQLSWRDLTKERCEQLAFQAIEEIAPLIQREILLSSNRYQYIKHKLYQIIYRVTLVLAEQGKKSEFAPIGIEVPFGETERIPSLTFPLPNGREIGLVGRIDRIDTATTANGTFLRIVDYKSGSKELDLAEVYYGLALQMLTYLDIAVTHSKKWIGKETTPAGVLYFHVHNPMLDVTKLLKQGQFNPHDIEEEIVEKFKMKGLILADEEVTRLMDNSIEDWGNSSIVSVGIKKTGGFTSASSIASMDELNCLTKHVRQQYVNVGTKITEGVIDVEPYKYKNKTPCTFCNYKSVCQFDDTVNKQRQLKPYKRKEVLTLLEEEGQQDEH